MGWFGDYVSNVGSTLRNYAGGATRIGIALLTLATPKLADASPIPPNTYLDPIEQKYTELLKYDSVTPTDSFDILLGAVMDKATGEPAPRSRLWFISLTDMQPVGVADMPMSGYYEARVTGDDRTPESPPGIDEGARLGDELAVIFQDLKTNTFRWGEFPSVPPRFQDSRGSPSINSEILYTNELVPEPATGILLGIGVAGALAAAYGERRKRST